MQPHAALRTGSAFEPLLEHASLPGQRPDYLLFDLCGVIFDNSICMRWLFQLVSRLQRVSFESFMRGWEQQHLLEVNGGKCDYWTAVQHYLSTLGLSRGAVDEICVAARARGREFDQSIRPLPGIKSGLAQLSASGQRLAVVGNLPQSTAEVRQCLTHLGVAELFSATFSSLDIGREAKPEERYRYIGERLSAAPQNIWFISANGLELQDATRQGLSAVAWQLSRAGKSIHSIDHLNDLLRGDGRNHSLAG